jgi:2-polyprenyl-3-methyl-5-hydroxy-6-metoxy-1,4-benzoquinol methylase
MLNDLPQRHVLDIGCSGGALKQLLSEDFTYFGCDLTDEASKHLPPSHFLQCDLNRSQDLSFFADQQINVIHVAGVLEYLREPQQLLWQARRLVASRSPLLVSLINFEAKRYEDVTNHHPAWVYKPTLSDFQHLLHSSGWRVERMQPFLGRGEFQNAWFRLWAGAIGFEHPLALRSALQFILLARAD